MCGCSPGPKESERLTVELADKLNKAQAEIELLQQEMMRLQQLNTKKTNQSAMLYKELMKDQPIMPNSGGTNCGSPTCVGPGYGQMPGGVLPPGYMVQNLSNQQGPNMYGQGMDLSSTWGGPNVQFNTSGNQSSQVNSHVPCPNTKSRPPPEPPSQFYSLAGSTVLSSYTVCGDGFEQPPVPQGSPGQGGPYSLGVSPLSMTFQPNSQSTGVGTPCDDSTCPATDCANWTRGMGSPPPNTPTSWSTSVGTNQDMSLVPQVRGRGSGYGGGGGGARGGGRGGGRGRGRGQECGPQKPGGPPTSSSAPYYGLMDTSAPGKFPDQSFGTFQQRAPPPPQASTATQSARTQPYWPQGSPAPYNMPQQGGPCDLRCFQQAGGPAQYQDFGEIEASEDEDYCTDNTCVNEMCDQASGYPDESDYEDEVDGCDDGTCTNDECEPTFYS